MNRKIRESGENRSQIIPHWKFQTTAAFHHRKDGRYFGSGLCAADVDPVLSSDCDRSHRVLGQVVTKLQLRIFQKPLELLPKREILHPFRAGYSAFLREL